MYGPAINQQKTKYVEVKPKIETVTVQVKFHEEANNI